MAIENLVRKASTWSLDKTAQLRAEETSLVTNHKNFKLRRTLQHAKILKYYKILIGYLELSKLQT
jgi:hypothetical protein